jgi:hypothetical protein
MILHIVNGEDNTCEPGYGMIGYDIHTSGYASQCSGVTSKITTEAECKLAADSSISRYGGRSSWSWRPPGCISVTSGTLRKYLFNDYIKSTTGCNNDAKCICKTKSCIKCPINTYSEGGTNPTCTPCPSHAPYTATNINIFTSINVCSDKKKG